MSFFERWIFRIGTCMSLLFISDVSAQDNGVTYNFNFFNNTETSNKVEKKKAVKQEMIMTKERKDINHEITRSDDGLGLRFFYKHMQFLNSSASEDTYRGEFWDYDNKKDIAAVFSYGDFGLMAGYSRLEFRPEGGFESLRFEFHGYLYGVVYSPKVENKTFGHLIGLSASRNTSKTDMYDNLVIKTYEAFAGVKYRYYDLLFSGQLGYFIDEMNGSGNNFKDTQIGLAIELVI